MFCKTKCLVKLLGTVHYLSFYQPQVSSSTRSLESYYSVPKIHDQTLNQVVRHMEDYEKQRQVKYETDISISLHLSNLFHMQVRQ